MALLPFHNGRRDFRVMSVGSTTTQRAATRSATAGERVETAFAVLGRHAGRAWQPECVLTLVYGPFCRPCQHLACSRVPRLPRLAAKTTGRRSCISSRQITNARLARRRVRRPPPIMCAKRTGVSPSSQCLMHSPELCSLLQNSRSVTATIEPG
jgi:hypothetical protein